MVAAISVSSIPDQRECAVRPVREAVVRDGSTTRRRKWGNFVVAADMVTCIYHTQRLHLIASGLIIPSMLSKQYESVMGSGCYSGSRV
jgi:hypothetical protein